MRLLRHKTDRLKRLAAMSELARVAGNAFALPPFAAGDSRWSEHVLSQAIGSIQCMFSLRARSMW